MELEALRRLAEWVRKTCNGDWEKGHGVTVSMIEKPGWQLEVDARDLPLRYKPYPPKTYNRSETDWIVCVVEDGRFRAWGGLGKLEEIIHEFLMWAEG